MLTLTVDFEFVLFLTSTLAHVPQVHKQTRLKVLIYAVISLPADTQLHQESATMQSSGASHTSAVDSFSLDSLSIIIFE